MLLLWLLFEYVNVRLLSKAVFCVLLPPWFCLMRCRGCSAVGSFISIAIVSKLKYPAMNSSLSSHKFKAVSRTFSSMKLTIQKNEDIFSTGNLEYFWSILEYFWRPHDLLFWWLTYSQLVVKNHSNWRLKCQQCEFDLQVSIYCD